MDLSGDGLMVLRVYTVDITLAREVLSEKQLLKFCDETEYCFAKIQK